MLLPCYGSEKITVAELALLGRYDLVPEPLFFSRVHVAGEDSRDSAHQQQEYVGAAKARRISPAKLKLLWGHASAVWQVPLPALERARCLIAVCRQ